MVSKPHLENFLEKIIIFSLILPSSPMIFGILPRPKQTTQLKLCLKVTQTKICIECRRPCSLCRQRCSHYNTKMLVCLSSLAARFHSSQLLNCKLLSGRRKKRSQTFWLTDSGRQLARQLLEPNVSGSCGETLASNHGRDGGVVEKSALICFEGYSFPASETGSSISPVFF